ncbi:MAG TPA: NAD(P)/FAD-dependent oxidoreductase [Casimicrobiaceae bacterium]|nr:NAD(P)/FAD-dependent oxidoreductase [Casimicrobiaceae bacterium]
MTGDGVAHARRSADAGNDDAHDALPVVIIGAGPGGLTAALELLRRSSAHRPIIIEALDQVGGLARTVRHRGNGLDIGGHRFFSKVSWVTNWWREILPLSAAMEAWRPGPDPSANLAAADALAVNEPERALLVRPRLSRILYLRRFFDYPISLSARTLRNLGALRVVRIVASYLKARALPIRPERNLEDFFINRFGRRLYETFFRDYTEKVWGVRCREISPQWGAQRIKGLSIAKAARHAIAKTLRRTSGDLAQRGTETSLIERFLYPKRGPGQMWETVAEHVRGAGGEIVLSTRLCGVHRDGSRVRSVVCENARGERREIRCHAVVSTMPIRDLAQALDPPPPQDVAAIAAGLCYRDFITIGVLLARMRPNGYVRSGHPNNLVPDTWIYVQEPDVLMGRLQIFNNWSPAMVADASRIWLGLEYFCSEGDALWTKDDEALQTLARGELVKLGFADDADILDMRVVKVPKAYPAYVGTYGEFERLRAFLDAIENLYPVGRNGMHRYNNQDHSMVSARLAVECILDPARDKTAIWKVNVEQEYHEEATTTAT